MKSLRRLHDSLLIDTIRAFILLPFQEVEISHDAKLCLAFGYPQRVIAKRLVLKPIKLQGHWWDDDGESKVVVNRTLRSKLFCFVREDERESTVDIEARCDVFKWDPKKRRGKASAEWFTFTISKEEYKKLDEVLGPIEDVCITKFHKEDEQ